VAVDATGKAVVVFGAVTTVAAANPVTGTDVTFGPDATQTFLVGANPLCAGLTGHIVNPSPFTMDPTKGDLCILVPSTGSIPAGTFTDAMFASSACHSL
jgi:hypothetical protein